MPCIPQSIYDSLSWFRKEFAEFKTDSLFEYNFIYIVSPLDDGLGYIMSSKWSGDTMVVEKGYAGHVQSYTLQHIAADSLNVSDRGDFCRFCNDWGNIELYFCALKLKGEVVFRYQSVNKSIELEFNDGAFPDLKKFFDRVKKL